MLAYTDAIGKKVIFIRKRCRCFSKRDHIFTMRFAKFCFHWDEISWHKGLVIIAIMTICFGIIEFISFYVLELRGAPSNIPSFLIMPVFSVLVYTDLIFFLAMGVMLWIGVYSGNLKFIKSFPWLLLFSYVLACCHIIQIIIDGKFVVFYLALSDFGMLIKSNPEREKKALLTEEIILYILILLPIFALILFPTYIIILSLSWIDRFEVEIEEEDV